MMGVDDLVPADGGSVPGIVLEAAKRKIPYWPTQYTNMNDVRNDGFLVKRSEDFDFNNPPFDPVEFVRDLGQIMLDFNGIGLAACQVNKNYRIFVIRTVPMLAFFNPKIVDLSGEETVLEEGCISFPGLITRVKRFDKVRIRYQQPNGETVTNRYEGMTARVIQHEYDHCEGILFTDRANRFHRDRSLRKWKLANR